MVKMKIEGGEWMPVSRTANEKELFETFFINVHILIPVHQS